jgi:hypothetical protein
MPVDGFSASGWRKTITGIDLNGHGGAKIKGEWLRAGDTVSLPEGTLVVSVDKRPDPDKLDHMGMAVEAVMVTLLLAARPAPDGPVTVLAGAPRRKRG